jgi:hypothetical protein
VRRPGRALVILLCLLVPTALAGSVAAAVLHGASSHRKPVDRKRPTITGVAQAGRNLRASKGRWVGASAFTYRWVRCNSHGTRCKTIGKGEGTKSKPVSYLIVGGDVGKTIRVTVTARNAHGKTSATSKPTAVIRRPRASTTPVSSGGGTSSTTTPTGTTPAATTPGTEQSYTSWLAWSGNITEAQIPWNAVTQVALFALSSTTSGSCTTNCTSLDTSLNSIDKMNVASWVSVVHQHGKLAIIAIGGSTDQDWKNACAANNIAGFTTSLVNYIVSNGFDGVDLDIESLSGSGSELTLWTNCVRSIAQAAHATLTKAGKTPIVSEDVDESWMDSAVANFAQYPDQFQLMYYGYPVGSWNCGAGSPANSCTSVNQLVTELHNAGQVPYDKMLLGMSPGGGQAQCCYVNLGKTAASVDTSGSVSAISLQSGLSSALPAGRVVLASTETPPSHYEIFTTSGAPEGATSVPITGTVSGSGSYAFPSGSEVQNDYEGPWDCGNYANYASTHGLEGVMIWDLQEEAGEHNGQFPCYDQVAPDIASQ